VHDIVACCRFSDTVNKRGRERERARERERERERERGRDREGDFKKFLIYLSQEP
jgi:hypothetical protein